MFNISPPTVMHIDLNSCFATVEQQANPLLRGKPVVVAAYTSPGGCILAASVEAKKLGIKTGMRVGDSQRIYPKLIVLPSDPDKYRFVNRKLFKLLSEYSSEVQVKSIDEMVVNFKNSAILVKQTVIAIGGEIKQRIRVEIGEWLTVSIGISTNKYLAKIASGLHKPDGLDVIDVTNIEEVLGKLELEDLCGIKKGYGGRLRSCGITTSLAFYQASATQLKTALHSITGFDWWRNLHGYDPLVEFGYNDEPQKSFGQSYALYKPFLPNDMQLRQILYQLILKMGRRLRQANFSAQGMYLSCLYRDYSYWQHGQKLLIPIYADSDFYEIAINILKKAPSRPIRILAVSCSNLLEKNVLQLTLFSDEPRKQKITQAIDAISKRWGEFTVIPGRMLNMERRVVDRIAFGK